MLNTELLSEVLNNIEQGYKHFNMSWWRHVVTERFKKEEKLKLDCGTTCCFAGETVYVTLGTVALEKAADQNIVADLAQALLGFTGEDKNQLFFVTGAMLDRKHYDEARMCTPGTKKYAKAVTNGIRKYIKDTYGVAV